MSFNGGNGSDVNEEQIASFLLDALKSVETASESDINALNEIKKIFKKNIPFFRRKYVAAYLIKQATSSRGGRYSRDRGERFSRDRRSERASRSEFNERNSRNRTEERTPSERPERAPRVQIDPAAATTIFIGIGRNRHVFPRDLVGLLISVAGLEKERIGDIKVLASYSFIQLYTEDCEKAISALNGYDFRGRKLSVSYSTKEGSSEKEDVIPESVTNEAHANVTEGLEQQKIAAEQSAFAASQSEAVEPVAAEPVAVSAAPYAETTDDGQVKSHFGDGAAY